LELVWDSLKEKTLKNVSFSLIIIKDIKGEDVMWGEKREKGKDSLVLEIVKACL